MFEIDPTVLVKFLNGLAMGGSIVLISWCAENFNWFANLEPMQKKVRMTICASALSCAAYAVATFVPVTVLTVIAPFAAIIIGTVSIMFVGEVYHYVAKRPKG